jgi:Xaa-Pro aminopeptidase
MRKDSAQLLHPLLHWAESYNDPDQYFLSGFLATDSFWVVERPGCRTVLGVNAMEARRARREARGARVIADPRPWPQILRRLLGKERELRVLPSFPLGMARVLEREGFTVTVDQDGTLPRRRRKTAAQINAIESVQRRLEASFALARDILAAAPVRRGALWHRGAPLTAAVLRGEIESFLLARGCECADTIVAPGRRAADPHWRGEGPIRANEPVVVDVFPRDKRTRFFSDMSRTFVKGKASDEVRAMHRAVCAAQDAAFRRLALGSRLDQVHAAVCAVFRRRGYQVPKPGRTTPAGFLHGTGHGLGLSVHEGPAVSSRSAARLARGDVITIEPGLYDPRLGGVRIEDVAAVTPAGRVLRLTDYPRDLEIP